MQGAVQNSESSGGGLSIFFISLVATIAGLLFGFDTGIIAGALDFVAKSFGIADADEVSREFIVSAVIFGALLGAMASSYCSDKLGRKMSIIATSVLFTMGTLCAALALNVAMVMIGRFVMGFAVGLSAMVVPMYLSEVAPPKVRGAVVFVFQLAITIGILMAYLIDYAFAGTGDWRWMFGVGIIPSIILGLGMLFLPDSPRWLVQKGRAEEARAVLRRIRAASVIDKEMEEIAQSVSRPQEGLSALFTPRLFPLVAVTFGLFVFQQVSGVNTIFYYGPEIFKKAGFSGQHGPILASVISGGVNVLATIIGVWIVDKLGRRKLLYVGFTGLILCLATLGSAYNGFFGPDIGAISLAAVLLFIVFFAISLGGVPYILMSELFPLNVRSTGMAVASCANWAMNLAVSATFLTLTHKLGMGNTYFLYGACTLAGLIFTIFLVPETKGRPLEEIEANLYAGKPCRDLGDPVD